MSQTEVQLIKDAVIVNADVSGSAAIDVSKISGAMPSAGGTFTSDVIFSGAGTNITFDQSTDDFVFNDGAKAVFGTGLDLQIFHGSNQSSITDSIGDLRLCSDHIRFRNGANSATGFDVDYDGATNLYFNGGIKFSTLTDGVKTNGDLTVNNANKLYLENDSENKSSRIFNSAASTHADITFYTAEEGGTAANRWQITKSGMLITATDSTYDIGESSNRVRNGYFDTLYGDGSNLTNISSTTINNNAANRVVTGSGTANTLSANSDLLWNGSRLDIDSGGTEDALRIGSSSGADTFIRLGSVGTTADTHAVIKYDIDDNNLSLIISGESHGSAGIRILNGGNVEADDILPFTNNSRDLGSTSKRWANVYTNDLNLSNEGSSNDVDGTWGSYTIQEGSEDLFLINKRNGKKFKFNLTEVS